MFLQVSLNTMGTPSCSTRATKTYITSLCDEQLRKLHLPMLVVTTPAVTAGSPLNFYDCALTVSILLLCIQWVFTRHGVLIVHDLCRATSFFDGQPPLSQGSGYAVVVGFGAFFSIFTTILVFLDYRFGGTKQTSEQASSITSQLCHDTMVLANNLKFMQVVVKHKVGCNWMHKADQRAGMPLCFVPCHHVMAQIAILLPQQHAAFSIAIVS